MFQPMLAAADSVSTAAGVNSLRLSSFPGEEPTIEEVVTYLDECEPMVRAVYGFELRGEIPPSLIYLSKADRSTGFSIINYGH